jgi:hypothetical protein
MELTYSTLLPLRRSGKRNANVSSASRCLRQRFLICETALDDLLDIAMARDLGRKLRRRSSKDCESVTLFKRRLAEQKTSWTYIESASMMLCKAW